MTFAMVFPGQGSQAVGMLSEMHEQAPIVTTLFEEASHVLGYDLWQTVAEGPAETLNQTRVTQPAILTASVALWRLFCARTELRPSVMAGHSLGEYSALVCADVVPFDEAVALVATRGELMQEAVPEGEGAMSVVLGLEDEVIIDVCRHAAQGQVVEAVNFNAPGQVVIAGNAAAVERAGAAAKEAGARRVQPLPVSVPAHSSLMRAAAERFADTLATTTIGEGRIPVLHNVGVDEVSDTRTALVEQLYSPVPWTRIVQTMSDRGVETLMECGPGKVLCGLARRIDRAVSTFPLHTPDTLATAIDHLTSTG
ncbi:MAG: ACP S-malonyltransferase [Pseudomonadota bacterium]